MCQALATGMLHEGRDIDGTCVACLHTNCEIALSPLHWRSCCSLGFHFDSWGVLRLMFSSIDHFMYKAKYQQVGIPETASELTVQGENAASRPWQMQL